MQHTNRAASQQCISIHIFPIHKVTWTPPYTSPIYIFHVLLMHLQTLRAVDERKLVVDSLSSTHQTVQTGT